MASYGRLKFADFAESGRMGEIQRIAANLREAMRNYARVLDGGCQSELPSGAAIVYSGLDYGVFNAVLPRYPIVSAQSLQADLQAASRYYESHRTGWSLWLCEDLIQPGLLMQVRGIIASHRLRRLADHQGMVAGTIISARRIPPQMEIIPVADDRTRGDFARVVSKVFSVPPQVSDAMYRGPEFWRDRYTAWVGYREKTPVCCMATHTAAGSVGVYSVAVMAACRGQGIGETITRHGLNMAFGKWGAQPSILQSTSAGIGLYRRMGYRPLANFSVFLAY
jgi:GNAT superfamily N-acetyltransferase